MIGVLLMLSVLVFFLLILRWRPLQIKGLSPWWMLSLFALKLMAAMAVWYIYSSVLDIPREEADLFKYYDDGEVMASSFEVAPSLFIDLFLDRADGPMAEAYLHGMSNWERSYELIQMNDKRTMIRLHALMHLLSRGHFLWHAFMFNVLAFLGLILLFKGLSGLTRMEPWTFILFILPPSLLFWGSAPLKEALVLLPMGVLLFAIKDLDTKGPNFLFMIIGIGMAASIKPYVSLALLPGILFLLSGRYWSAAPQWRFLAIHLGMLLALFLSQWIPSLDVVSILSWKQKDFIGMAESVDAGSLIQIPRFNDFLTFIKAWPGAIWRTYFRPGVWEIRSALDGMSALENSLYLLLLVNSMSFRKRDIDWRILLFCLSFLAGMGILIGTVTPVLGASVRYRAPALPFLLILFYLVLDTSYLGRFFQIKSLS